MNEDQSWNRWSMKPLALGADGEVACPSCSTECLEWHGTQADVKDMSFTVRTRCENCAHVADLHVVWHKGSILTRWIELGYVDSAVDVPRLGQVE